jgi:hypothetical protein
MRREAALWAAAGIVSLAAHGAVLQILVETLAPRPVPQQPVPESRLDLSAYPVERTEATPRPAESEPAAPGSAPAPGASQAHLPMSRVAGTPPPADRISGRTPDTAALAAQAAPADGARLAARVAPAAAATAVAPEPTAARPTAAEPDSARAAAPPTISTAAAQPDREAAAPLVPERDAASAMLPDAVALATAAPQAQPLATGRAEAVQLTAAPPPQAPAAAAAPDPARLAALAAPQSDPARPSTPHAQRAAAAVAPTAALAALTGPVADETRPVGLTAQTAPAATPALVPLTAAPQQPSVTLVAARAETASTDPVAPDAANLAQVPAVATLAPGGPVDTGAALDAVSPAQTETAALPQALAAAPAPTLVVEGEHHTAALAWSGADGGVIDPVSLAAIEAFMQPVDPSRDSGEDSLRDGISALLSSVPCSRLQTVFVPETATLELRGHLPDNSMREPLRAALSESVGSDIEVADQLLLLPHPQCAALSGIGDVGLPQSTEQITNPRIVGQDSHVREFRYTSGDRLEFELTAPDYDSFVYVDYFDADGMVIHLQPNEIVPLMPAEAKSPLTVGVERDDIPALHITIGPPFGQEIAVAFATSVPLYEEPRPLREPAEAYLEFLRDRVAELRDSTPDFKGEWVYFFISTAP